MEGASVLRAAGAVWALLVYGEARSHIAALCVSGLQRSEGWAVGSVSVGWRIGIVVGEVGVGVGRRVVAAAGT
jgi:hypothetical protein